MSGREKYGLAQQSRHGNSNTSTVTHQRQNAVEQAVHRTTMEIKMAFAKKEKVAITPPNIKTAKFKITGTAPLVMNKFSSRALEQMAAKQAAGSVAAKRSNREAKDFDLCTKEATHFAEDGWCGIPASAFRAGLISTCRLLGFPMTLAKLSVFVVADGYERDRFGVQPLVKITKGKPKRTDFAVRNETGVADIRPRPMWDEGWEAVVTIEFDADQFTLADVTNLLARMGRQVGVGAGRPDSKDSAGMGWGTFRLAEAASSEFKAAA